MLNLLRNAIPERHPFRLLYHKVMAVIAAVFYGFPANNLIVVGVTGTNGKTTTCDMTVKILEAAGYKVGLSSTIAFQVGENRMVNVQKQTTVSPFQLQKLLREMVKAGCSHAVVEVTSHAVDQSRIFGINFDVAAVTNVTPDHVEYHGDFNSYLTAKGGLFKRIGHARRKLGRPKVLILNADDEYYSFFDQYVADRKITYGLREGIVRAENIVKEPRGSTFTLRVPNNSSELRLRMPGEFNIYNALTAASICMALDVPIEIIARGLSNCSGVSGRFELVDVGQNFDVVVDYAHTPEALENLLKLYKGLTKGRLFAVFGATGGGRDKSKRPLMGTIADKNADYVIVTDDDPYVEDEWEIIKQVSSGISRREGENFWMIPDRREAIRLALSQAQEGDTVVVAGKGAEEVMMLRGKRILWNDRKVITELLESAVKVELL